MTADLAHGLTWRDLEKTWGTPVRLRGGHLTHWAGRETQNVRLLAHGDYAWADRITEPYPDGKQCQRCKRRQPYFITAAALELWCKEAS